MNTNTATIVYQTELSTKAKTVFMYLAYRSNKENSCFPGLRRIAHDCSISPSTAQRAIRELVKAGLVTKQVRHRQNGSQTSNLYNIVASIVSLAGKVESKEAAVKKECERLQKKKEKAFVQEAQLEMEVNQSAPDSLSEQISESKGEEGESAPEKEEPLLEGGKSAVKRTNQLKENRMGKKRRKLWENQKVRKNIDSYFSCRCISSIQKAITRPDDSDIRCFSIHAKQIWYHSLSCGLRFFSRMVMKRLKFQDLTRGDSQDDHPGT